MTKKNGSLPAIGKNLPWIRGQYYARVVVPVELRSIILKPDGTPRSEFKEPLGADKKLAERKSHAIFADIEDQLDLAKAHLAASKPTLASAAKAAYRVESDIDLLERANPDWISNDWTRAVNANKMRGVAAGTITGDEAEALIGYSADLLIANQLAVASTPTERAALLMRLASVRLDTMAVAASRDKGELFAPEPRDELLLEPEPAKLPPIGGKASLTSTGLSLEDLLKKFHGERTGGTEKTRNEHTVAIRMLSGFLGKGRVIREITRAEMIAYKDALRQLPTNSQQRFRGMTVPQAIKANAKRAIPYKTLDPATINDKWLMHLNNIFNWAVNNDLMESSPAKGVKIDIGKGFKEPSRVPFSQDDIKAMFSNPFFTEAKKFDSRHWALLVALYTGARSSSEIQRIKLDDIYKEQGIDVIHLSEASKNVQSKRIVPVHKALIDLGFVEYIDGLRKDGETRLFPDWEPKDKINRWFLRTYREMCGIDDSRKVFHSFRHSLKTALAKYGINRDISDLITGHKDQSVGGIYISDQATTMVQSMAEGLNRVDFGISAYFQQKTP
jgi:integrase